MPLSNNNQKRIIHMLKAKYELSDVDYVNFLVENFNGIDSSIGLSEEQADYCIHLLNYTYNQDYKQGYVKCLEYNNLSLFRQFQLKIEMKYERKVTNVEEEMFLKFDKEQQIKIIDKI